jgi:putative tryptophan/tyrosine transport system substrate-binding protein
MNRRAFVTGLGAVLAAPLFAQAQAPSKIFRIGPSRVLSPTSTEAAGLWAAFLEGLRERGYVEGRNVAIAGRYYGDKPERLPALAEELVRVPVDVIVVGGSPAPEAAKRAMSTIPIVLTSHGDPVGSGLVASLARPAGNITGVSARNVHSKRLQLVKEAMPRLTSVGVLLDANVPSRGPLLSELEVAARSLKIQLEIIEVGAPSEFADAFSAVANKRAGAMIIVGSPVFFSHRARLAELAAKSRMPTMCPSRGTQRQVGLWRMRPMFGTASAGQPGTWTRF